MITAIYLHDPPPLNGLFFMTPPFSASQKVETLPPFPHPSPLLISDKSLAYFEPTGSCFPNLICQGLYACVKSWVYTNIQKISVVHALTCLANLSERIRERKPLHSPFFLSPTFARNLRPTSYPSFKELINNSRKYRIFFYSSIKPSKHVKKLYLIG